MNPLLGESNLKSAYKALNDPKSIIENNPQLKGILSLYNGNAKEAFYALCKQRGVDPESILSKLR